MDDTAAGGPAETPDPAVADIPLDTAVKRPGSRARRGPVRVAVASAIAAGLVVAGVGAVVWSRPGDDVDPEAALERAQAALAGAGSYRMTVTTEDRSGAEAASGPGTQMVTRVVDEVEVSGDDWRRRGDAGDWAYEAVAVGDTTYMRAGDDATPIEGEKWGAWPRPEAGAGVAAVDADDFTWAVDQIAMMVESGLGPDDPDLPDDAFIDEMLVSLVGSLYLAG